MAAGVLSAALFVPSVEAQSCIVTTDVGGSGGGDEAWDLALQVNGKIIVVGESLNGANDDFGVVRYNADFTLDTSFDTDGIVHTNISGWDRAEGVAIDADGKIVVGGSDNFGGNDDFVVVRYDPTDGSLDPTFDGDGIATTPVGGSWDLGTDLAIQTDGKILLGGYYQNAGNYDLAVVRFDDTDGSLDTSFDGDGIVVTPMGSRWNSG
jgi:uncharacterized delta-60 repeat protein